MEHRTAGGFSPSRTVAEAVPPGRATLLAPLNNWSEELIKFKVAAYPGRVYYGQIDKTKIDEIYLDLYSLYGSSDVSGMEEKAIDFTRRLVTTRLLHFTKTGLETFIDTADGELWRLMFYATMANPRNLGHTLRVEMQG